MTQFRETPVAEHTTFETAGRVATLTFNRPEARNAMTWEMYESLVAACDRVDGDEAIRVLVFRGAGGKAFVAGTDISQFQNFQNREDGLKYEERLDHVLDRLERVTKPTIAQVEGVAAGGGCAIALTCDLRVATPEATFGIPIARTLGNCLSGASYSRLLDVMGPGAAKDMLFTGRFIAGAEAHALGIVNRLVPMGEIEATVRALASEIAANAPLTLRATKEMIRRVLAKRRLAAGDDADMVELCYTSADFREGVTAFLAKRKPTWTGR
jgi:enoyl-CoA hydratase/carnithine racemase